MSFACCNFAHAGVMGNKGKSLLFWRMRQTFVALGPFLLTISVGLAEGYSAVLLPQLERGSPWEITDELSSWIASITTLPMSFGCLLGGVSMEIVGRKSLFIITSLINVFGWLLIAFCGQSIAMLLAGRFITGLCVGIISAVISVFVAETSDPESRGFLLGIGTSAVNVGIAAAHVLGTYLEWRMVAVLSCAFPISCFVVMLFVPESPTFLIKRGKLEKGKEAFYWCRGHGAAAELELSELISRHQAQSCLPKMSISSSIKSFTKPELYKPLLILIVFFTTMQWSGNNPIAFYTINILEQLLKGRIDSYTSMFFMDATRVIASIMACFCQRYLGRRSLMIFSCLGTFLSLLTLSTVSFLALTYTTIYEKYMWISVTALVAYMFFTNVGLVPLPYSMIGELFSQRTRGLGSGTATFYNMILMFVIVKITPFLFKSLASEGAFLLFAGSCFVGMVLLIFILPETKAKPLHEIEDNFRNVSNKTKQCISRTL
ncbi:facilitated trehalose transporter Tret1-2 homolog [Cylas formicarius]|uniref:facilitated trehalose transporter Tret1-2 homolog n=1 Tax=Cylas formicarius TaxID=197179 RepID=UPI002958BF8B|nr:facilitated trehalose transporter Tret1-2 homolog [Cylas formicarius]